jgi:hypothetical protein
MEIPIIRHIIIKNNVSPYDATLEEYFKIRDKKYKEKNKNRRQFGQKVCSSCMS